MEGLEPCCRPVADSSETAVGWRMIRLNLNGAAAAGALQILCLGCSFRRYRNRLWRHDPATGRSSIPRLSFTGWCSAPLAFGRQEARMRRSLFAGVPVEGPAAEDASATASCRSRAPR